MLIIENAGDDKLNMLKYAIENKYEIVFWYRGVKVSDPNQKKYTRQNYRRVQPVALGKSKATGKWMLRAYQTTGVTNTANQKWKTFLVDEIKDGTVEILFDSNGKDLKTFDPKSDYRRDGSDKKMDGNKAITFLDTGKPAGPKDANFKDPNYKAPSVENKPEDEEQNTEISETHSSGFLKWIYNIYG